MITITEDGLARLKVRGAQIRRSDDKKRVEPTLIAKKVAEKVLSKPEVPGLNILPFIKKSLPSFDFSMKRDKQGWLTSVSAKSIGADKSKVYEFKMERDKKGLLKSVQMDSGTKHYKFTMNRDKKGFLSTIKAKPV